MNRKLVLLAVIVVILVAAGIFYVATPRQVGGQGGQLEVVAENLEVPWAMDFLPDGRLIFTERPGKVSVLEDNQVKVVGNINVTASGESGLLGVAVDPQFNQNRYVYLYFTQGSVNRVARYQLGSQLENQTIIVDNIPAAQIHDGGRIKFGPDGKLYVATGDAAKPESAQDINSLAGKILRVNPDGSVPSDNPFNNYVYSYGHRNPQGLAWSDNGTFYASEHGQSRNDEVNIIIRGGNYGWPTIEGNTTRQGFEAPLRVYQEFTIAPSGLAYNQNNLYLAGLRGTQLRRLQLAADGRSVTSEEPLFTELGRLRDVVVYDGYLYISTSNRDGRGVPKSGDDQILRLKL